MLPETTKKHHVAALGTNGSGKTTVVKAEIVEPALAAGERCCVIDPTGVWYGLRLGANGKPKGGFSVYIVGGEHADFPLAARDGELWAEVVGTSADSFVFDVSMLTVADRTRFFTGFAEKLIRANKGPLRLVIDEAHLFAPQGGARAGGLAPDMLHATNNLLALGRSKGLRVVMISQRPAKLHKDSLSQAHALIALKMVSPQDRNAVKDWVADQTDPESGKELIASLPTLKPGEGWLWAPGDGILERRQFPRARTYDSSAAPEIGEADAPKLAPIDPEALQGRLKAVAADAKANDPKALAATVARLQAELATKPAADPVASAKEREDAYQAGFAQGAAVTLRKFDAATADLAASSLALRTASAKVDERIIALRSEIVAAQDSGVTGNAGNAPPAPAAPRAAPPTPPKAPAAVQPPFPGAGDDLPKGELAVFAAIALKGSPQGHGGGATREFITLQSSYKRSTRDAYIQRLLQRGLIEIFNNRLWLTVEGGKLLDRLALPPLPRGQALRDHLAKTLPAGEAAVLMALFDVYPEGMSREEISNATNYKRSTRDAYIQRLAVRELIEVGGDIRASDELFLE